MNREPRVTLGEFIARVENEFDCQVLEEPFSSSIGQTSVRIVCREMEDGQELMVVLPGIGDDEIIANTVLNNMCRRLDIPVREFGFIARM